MATKIIHTCDYCGQEMTDSGIGMKIVLWERGSAIVEHGWVDVCFGCSKRIREHLEESISQLGDNCHDH